jgi:fumarylacetoacetase
MMSKANDPALKSWVDVHNDSDFPVQNIPFGVFRTKDRDARPASRIGDSVIDLSALVDHGYFDDLGIDDLSVFYAHQLNPFIGMGKRFTNSVRERISELFRDDNPVLRDNREVRSEVLVPVSDAEMLMPVFVPDYTDFYSSEQHAFNVGAMFRDPDNALLPNWKHIPVGYHGRASSIVASGASIHRPKGQTLPGDAKSPVFGPSKLLDFELEMAFITGKETQLGESVPVDRAEEYIFGLVIFNDLSARDIQKWEYVPLGPFLAKNFGSVISPWIITLEALEPFRTAGPGQDPKVLPYLDYKEDGHFDLDLEVYLKPEGGDENLLCRSNLKHLYWNMKQQLAHHTVNGCNISVGDMYASGTISGPDETAYGSMLELSWKGTKPIRLSDGSERKFIQDHDTVIMRGHGIRDGVRIGFGESVTKILPATE